MGKQRLSNEEMVTLYRAGDAAAVEELWRQNQGIVHKVAGRFLRLAVRGAADEADLYQAGFLALMDAVRLWDPERGGAFISVLTPHLFHRMQDVCRLHSRRQLREGTPLSLDAPLSAEDGDGTLQDIVADTSLVPVEEQAVMEDTRRRVQEALNRLPKQDAELLHRVYWRGQSLRRAARALGLDYGFAYRRQRRALVALRKDVRLLRLVDEQTGFYRHKGVTAFNSSFSSTVEDAVARREEVLKRLYGGGAR